MRKRTRCWDTSSASRGICPARFRTWSGPRPSGPNPPRPTQPRGGVVVQRLAREGGCRTAREREARSRVGRRARVPRNGAARNGRLAGARASLQRAIALSPATAAVYVDLGVTFLRAGESEQGPWAARGGLELPSPVPPRQTGTRPSPRSGRPRLDPQHPETPRRTTCSGSCSAARARAATRWRPRSARRSGCGRTIAEAHNNLGLVLIQAGRRRGRHRRVARSGAPRPGLRGSPREPRRGLDADRRRGSGPGAGEGRRAGAGLGQGPFNLAVAYGASPAHGPGKEIEQLGR